MNLVTLNLVILLAAPLAIADDVPMLYKCQDKETQAISYQDFPCGAAKLVKVAPIPKVTTDISFPKATEVPLGYYQKRIGTIGRLENPVDYVAPPIVMPYVPPASDREYIQ